jgi:hypothetical protein
LFEEGSLQALGTLNQNNGILGNFADDANLPEKIDDFESKFNEYKSCELCDKAFKAIYNPRHHCRKCNKSVCQMCSSNKRKLAKNDDNLHRICDFCDT